MTISLQTFRYHILLSSIPGYDLFEGNMSGYEKNLRYSPPLDPYLTGLVKLENVRDLLSDSDDKIDKIDSGIIIVC